MKLSIVTTLYKSSPYINEFYQRAGSAAKQLVEDDYEIIFVNDGSPDDSLAIAVDLSKNDDRVTVIDLSRNFGHHKAMMTGLAHAKGELIFLLDSDLEEQPEWLSPFYKQLEEEKCDVVYGVQVDKYTWQEVGSSFLPGEVIAAFLWAQFEEAENITQKRMECWDRYHEMLEPFETKGLLRRPVIPPDCQHNAHMYYILLETADRSDVLKKLKDAGIHAVFHYIPLHSSPAGMRYGRAKGDLSITNRQSERLIRLPLWVGLSEDDQAYIVDVLEKSL